MKNEYEPTTPRLARFLQTMLVYGRGSEAGLDPDLCDLLHIVPIMINDPWELEFCRDWWLEHLREFDREHEHPIMPLWVTCCESDAAIYKAIEENKEGAGNV